MIVNSIIKDMKEHWRNSIKVKELMKISLSTVRVIKELFKFMVAHKGTFLIINH